MEVSCTMPDTHLWPCIYFEMMNMGRMVNVLGWRLNTGQWAWVIISWVELNWVELSWVGSLAMGGGSWWWIWEGVWCKGVLLYPCATILAPTPTPTPAHKPVYLYRTTRIVRPIKTQKDIFFVHRVSAGWMTSRTLFISSTLWHRTFTFAHKNNTK